MKQIQLAIPKPCHENWDAMTPEGRGRHCAACATTVVDFTTMSDAELLQFFTKEKKANTCGRVSSQQLNRNIIAPQKKPLGYRHYFAALLLLLLNKPVDTKAQKRPAIMGLVANTDKPLCTPDTVTRAIPFNKYIFSGTVRDEVGQPVRNAVIKVIRGNSVVVADGEGYFSITTDGYPFAIEISAPSFETKLMHINDEKEDKIMLSKRSIVLKELVVNSQKYTSGKMIIMGGITSVCTKRQTNFITDTLKKWRNKISSPLKVYPNPVTAGALVTVAFNPTKIGHYTLQINDISGKIMERKKLPAVDKNHHEQLRVDNEWPSGIYYIQLRDEAGNNCGTSKLVVE